MTSIQSYNPGLTAADTAPQIAFRSLADQIDTYSQDTFQELQNKRFDAGLDFYICALKEDKNIFYFDASMFIENCIRSGKIINNPFNRNHIEDFEIYVSTKSQRDLMFVMGKDKALETINLYPVHWNNPDLRKSDRLSFMTLYAEHFEKTDLKKAVTVYELAAKRGSISAKISLANIYTERKERDSAVKWLLECIEDPQIETKNIYACAKKLTQLKKPELAFKAYVAIADRDDQYGLGCVILFLEKGCGSFSKDLIKAKEWRQKLPPEWRNKPIKDYFAHLKQKTQNPSVPQNERWGVPNIISSTATIAGIFFSGIGIYFAVTSS